jgi:hypothetical protein
MEYEQTLAAKLGVTGSENPASDCPVVAFEQSAEALLISTRYGEYPSGVFGGQLFAPTPHRSLDMMMPPPAGVPDAQVEERPIVSPRPTPGVAAITPRGER